MLLPPPPLPPLLPPLLPPPLLPPPPQPAARVAFPEVPVIPEADSGVLLGVGVLALAGVAALRRGRRRPE